MSSKNKPNRLGLIFLALLDVLVFCADNGAKPISMHKRMALMVTLICFIDSILNIYSKYDEFLDN